MTERFGDADIRADSTQHLIAAKSLQQLVQNQPLDVRSEVDLHRRDREAEKRGAQVQHHLVIRPRKQPHAVEGQIVEPGRHQHAIGREQRADHDVGGGRGRIEQDDVVVRLDRLQRFGETARICDRDRSVEIPVGCNHVNAWFAGRAHGGDKIDPRLAKYDVARGFGVRRTNAKAKSGVTLRIDIHHQDPVTPRAKFRRQVDRQCRFARAAFPVCDCESARLHRSNLNAHSRG